jgi:hypothetical protein
VVRRTLIVAIAAGAIALVVAACKPALDDTVSIVTVARVLAVRTDPAEAAPKASVTYSALVVDPSGTLHDAPLDWAFCNLRKPLAELGPVSPFCMTRDGFFLAELGAGTSVTATISDTACRAFGPDVPVPDPGQPAGRPVDPDLTGGYYQPLRLVLSGAGGDVFTLERSRIACGVVGATAEQLSDFAKRYRPNVNPGVDALVGDGVALVAEGGGTPGRLAAGARVTLRASWAACEDPTKSCTGSETYPLFDLASRAIVDQREAIHVAWFATGGAFDADHTGRDSSDPTPFSENGWVAPSQQGTVHLWIVLRDERGGVGWQGFVVDVE